MSRQNRDPVIRFLRNRYTLVAERLEGFEREIRPLQLLQQQHIRFANFQPCRDMGQPRANGVQIPTSDFQNLRNCGFNLNTAESCQKILPYKKPSRWSAVNRHSLADRVSSKL